VRKYSRRNPKDWIGNAVLRGVLDVIAEHPQEVSNRLARSVIDRLRQKGDVPLRKHAYQVGAQRFGVDYLDLAQTDNAQGVRTWAQKEKAKLTGQVPAKPRSRRQ